MTVAILHHAGDGNVLPVRTLSTWGIAAGIPSSQVFVAVKGWESFFLESQIGAARVTVRDGATDTLSEIVLTMPDVLAFGADILYISTEPGHVRRAAILAWIAYLGRGVRVVPRPSAPGAYRDPWWLVWRDVPRALWARVTHP